MSYKTDTAKIKRWREERHWSQEHLAELAGVGLRTIQRIENGQPASPDSLKALASAYQVDVAALYVDPYAEAAAIVKQKNAKSNAALQLSFWIHLASWAIGMAVFAAISLGAGVDYWVMKWPTLWWTVGLISHGATVAIVWVALRYQEEHQPV
ncbi:MAG: XRE family transcriptional regulator [Ponticaulis sp.]|nr:XRE family transcriptional regulator [Ponticaulis sp.]